MKLPIVNEVANVTSHVSSMRVQAHIKDPLLDTLKGTFTVYVGKKL